MRSIEMKVTFIDKIGKSPRIRTNEKKQNSKDVMGGNFFMQQLISTNVVIQIPADQVLITKIEFDELKQHELYGMYWSMKDLEKRTNKKHEWIKENMLYPERFKKVLDVDCGGFVFYPKSKGQNWSFHATKMANFLDVNFREIFI